MPSVNSAYKCFYGSGYLLLDDGSSPMVGYKLVLDLEDFGGGGFLLGLSDKDSCKAEKQRTMLLSLGSDKYISLFVGNYDGDSLPILAFGFTKGPDMVH